MRNITLLTAATASAAPTIDDETAGVDLPSLCDQVVLLVKSTAGSGVMTASLRLWGFYEPDGRWYDLGALPAVSETSTADVISAALGIAGLRPFSRLHCEITLLGGTNTAITVQAACIPADPVTTS